MAASRCDQPASPRAARSLASSDASLSLASHLLDIPTCNSCSLLACNSRGSSMGWGWCVSLELEIWWCWRSFRGSFFNSQHVILILIWLSSSLICTHACWTWDRDLEVNGSRISGGCGPRHPPSGARAALHRGAYTALCWTEPRGVVVPCKKGGGAGAGVRRRWRGDELGKNG
jgi:hypothetical protein